MSRRIRMNIEKASINSEEEKGTYKDYEHSEKFPSDQQGRYMTSVEIREAFLRYYREKHHKQLPSASLIPDDSSILLTIAGMVPFKPYFLALQEPPASRIVTCQRCIRTNDIENVGVTKRHHTFFEMLGNFFVWRLL
eukprot:jgi/Galph1/2536/GphlegSOOS_G1230.1